MEVAVAIRYDPRFDNEPDLPLPWQPRSSSASPLGNALQRRCVASAQALAMKVNALNSKDLAMPVSTAFRGVNAVYLTYPSEP